MKNIFRGEMEASLGDERMKLVDAIVIELEARKIEPVATSSSMIQIIAGLGSKNAIYLRLYPASAGLRIKVDRRYRPSEWSDIIDLFGATQFASELSVVYQRIKDRAEARLRAFARVKEECEKEKKRVEDELEKYGLLGVYKSCESPAIPRPNRDGTMSVSIHPHRLVVVVRELCGLSPDKAKVFVERMLRIKADIADAINEATPQP